MIEYTVELRWKMTHHLLIGRVTKTWRQTCRIIERARTAVKFEHVVTQFIPGLTSNRSGCVLLWDSALEGRKLNTVSWRNIIWLVKALLDISGTIINSHTVCNIWVECHHSSNRQIDTLV